jgi:cation:H+ antiporter
MTPAAAIPVFLASVALMIGASAVFARRLDQAGLRLGMPEAILGLLTALAADAPEIASAITALVAHQKAVAVGVVVGSNAFNLAAMLGLSAIVASRVRARHETLELEAFVGIWLLVVCLAVVTGAIGATIGLILVAVVIVPYVAVLAIGPGRIHSRFLAESFGEQHVRDETTDARHEIAGLVVSLLVAIVLIVGGSIGAVRSVTDLAHAWSIPQALVGVVILAVLTSLPNAWTGVRFGLQDRGSALMSETLNSNSINLVAGIAVPAALGAIGSLSGLDTFDVVWLVVMTVTALVLFGRRGGAGTAAGVLMIGLYAVFLAAQFR